MGDSLDSAVARLVEFGGWIGVTSASGAARLRIDRHLDQPGVARLFGVPPIDGQPDRRREVARIRSAMGGTRYERMWYLPPDRPDDIAVDIRAGFTAILGMAPPDLEVDDTWINEPSRPTVPGGSDGDQG